MEVEHDVKMIPIDEHFQAEVEKLAKEGWQFLPGIKPIAIYHVARAKQAPPSAAGMGQLTIDDSKVIILKPDGSTRNE